MLISQSLWPPLTVANYLTLLPQGALERLRGLMIRRLIHMKASDGDRSGDLWVAVDAAGQMSFGGRRHCPRWNNQF